MLNVAAATITSMELYRVVPEESSPSVVGTGCGVVVSTGCGVVVGLGLMVVVEEVQLSGGGVTIPVNGGREVNKYST